MIRDVDLVSYLPPFVADYKETNLTLTAENPEFVLVWKAADRVLKNEFIATADEYGIGRFEKILHIFPSINDTLEIRRARVQTKWFTVLPYTWRMFVQKIAEICRSDWLASYTERGGYMICLEACIELQWQIESLIDVAGGMLPCNMGLRIKNVLSLDFEKTTPVVRPSWFGYAVEYRGEIVAGESSMMIKTICMHVPMPFWGGGTYNGCRRYNGTMRYNAKRSYELRVKMKNVLQLYAEQAIRYAAIVFGGHMQNKLDTGVLLILYYCIKLKEMLHASMTIHTELQFPSGVMGGMTVETRRNVVRYNGMRRHNGTMKHNALYRKEIIE